MSVRLPRPLRLRPILMVGIDVTAHKRAVYRALGDEQAWAQLKTARMITRRTYGPFFETHVRRARKRARLPEEGGLDAKLYQWLRARGAYRAYEDSLLLEWTARHPVLTVVHPIPAGRSYSVCQGLHQTSGLVGNWALDLCAAPGTPLLAPEECRVVKLSGRPPGDDTADRYGVFGWSVHLEALRTYRWFVTHLGTRPATLRVGERIPAGTVLGLIGDQHYRIDHAHIGVTSSLGTRDAKRRVQAMLGARRIDAR